MADRDLEKDLGLVMSHGNLILKQSQTQVHNDAKDGPWPGVRLDAGSATLDQANGGSLLAQPRVR